MRYLLFFILLTSCKEVTTVSEENIKVVEYDGCEYIYINDRYKGMSSHKGNCKNPIHKCQ